MKVIFNSHKDYFYGSDQLNDKDSRSESTILSDGGAFSEIQDEKKC